MKTAITETSTPTTIVCCPNCDYHIELKPGECGLEHSPRSGSDNLNVEVFCDNCNKAFIIVEITY